MKIIGKATTISLSFESAKGDQGSFSPETYNIVAIGNLENGKKIYITDQEYKPGQPLVLIEDLIKEYVPN